MDTMLTLAPTPGFSPRVGSFVMMLEDVRRRLIRYVEGLTAEQLSWYPNDKAESIGTVLLHIAAVEFSYIQEDIIRTPMGEEWKIAFPIRFGIPQVSGEGLDFYIAKLAEVRRTTLDVLKNFTDDDLLRIVQPLEPGDPTSKVEYSIEWILYHLIEHEAHHKGQIAIMKRLLP